MKSVLSGKEKKRKEELLIYNSALISGAWGYNTFLEIEN